MKSHRLKALHHRVISRIRLLAGVVAGAVVLSVCSSQAAQIACDIVINGGSLSAPAAALAAARVNPNAQILLVEPTDWLGGQATAQGVAAIDNVSHQPGAGLMSGNPPLYYPADYLNWLNRIKTAPVGSPGTGFAPNGSCWVSREAFDPRTGAWALDQMIAATTSVTVMKMTVVKNVTTATISDSWGSGRKITGLALIQRTPLGGYVPHTKFLSQEMPDWYSATNSSDFSKTVYNVVPRDVNRGLIVIDASECADVIVLSGATYAVGREQMTERMNEDGTLPTIDENGSQACVFPFCMTDAASSNAETQLKSPWADFDTYYAMQNSSYFSLGSYSWARVWTYRRLKCNGVLNAFDTVNQGDVTMQNWNPGNDYPYASIFMNKLNASAQGGNWLGGLKVDKVTEAEKHATAWYFWMKAHKTVAWDTRMPYGSTDSLNMMGTGTGLAKFPYIRDTRRIVGLENFRLASRYFVNTQSANYTTGSSYRFYDSVGIANYAMDIHPTNVSTGMSPPFSLPAPFYVPYRALGATNVRNLMAAGKLIATTYVSNSAYRLHPIEWVIGSASGSAAGIMARDVKTNIDLMDLPALRELQTLVNQNSPVSWAAYDIQPLPTQNGDLIVNDLQPVVANTAFNVEVYHHRAVRARVFMDSVFLGETTTRANGRLLLSGISIATPGSSYWADCYDAAGTLLDTLTYGAPNTRDITVTDDADPGFSKTSGWTTANAQPNKYASSYRYVNGTVSNASATWLLYIPRPGYYQVRLWYPESSNRATDAPFTVYFSGGQQTFSINQQQFSNAWKSLGTFYFSGSGTERVVLRNTIANTAQLVIADAVKATFVAPAEVQDWKGY